MKRVIRPAAKADILRQFRFYLREGDLAAADGFVDAVEAQLKRSVEWVNGTLSESWSVNAVSWLEWGFRCEGLVEHRQQEERQDGGTHQAADHDGG